MSKDDIERFCPKSQAEWRAWLQLHHETHHAVWLVYYRKSTNVPSLSWSEAVDQALCFGWIDSTKKTIDDDKYMQYFCKRKPNSTWSKVNKDKVDRLTKDNLMTQGGLDSIATAKSNGAWALMDDVEAGNCS